MEAAVKEAIMCLEACVPKRTDGTCGRGEPAIQAFDDCGETSETRMTSRDRQAMICHQLVPIEKRYRMCKQYTVRAHVFLMRAMSACLSHPVVTVVQVDTAA